MESSQKKVPGSGDLLDTLKAGEVDYMFRTTNISNNGGETEKITGNLYIMPIEMKVKGRDETQETYHIYEMVGRLKRILTEHNKQKVSFSTPEGIDRQKNQEDSRMCLQKQRHHYKVPYPRHRKGQIANTSKRGENTQYARNLNRGDAIMIKATDTNYADILKHLKTKLNDNTIAEINEIRKTAKRDLLLKIKSKAGDVKKKIGDVMENAEIKLLQNKKGKIVYIKDVEAPIGPEEIKRALVESGQIKEEKQVVIKTLRPTPNGNQTTIIEMKEEDAKGLVQKSKMRLGLSVCKIQERIEVEKCYRYWTYGHKAWNCSRPDKRESCLNCAKEGHKRKDCQEEAFCPLCEARGHEAGSGRRCEAFKRALEARQRRRIK